MSNILTALFKCACALDLLRSFNSLPYLHATRKELCRSPSAGGNVLDLSFHRPVFTVAFWIHANLVHLSRFMKWQHNYHLWVVPTASIEQKERGKTENCTAAWVPSLESSSADSESSRYFCKLCPHVRSLIIYDAWCSSRRLLQITNHMYRTVPEKDQTKTT